MTQRSKIKKTEFWRSGFFVLFIRLWTVLAAMIAASSELQAQGSTEGSTANGLVSASPTSQSAMGATPVLAAGIPSSSQSTRRLSLSTSLSLSSNLAEFSSFENQSSVDFEVAPTYTINSKSSVSAAASVSKDLQGEQQLTLLNDAVLSYSRKGPKLWTFASTGISTSGVLPLSKSSRERDSLMTSLSVKPSISFTTGIGKVSYRIGFTRHLHRFTTATYGKSNAEWGLSNSLDYSANLTERVSMSLSATFANAWTYGGSLNQSFKAAQDFTYEAGEALAFSIGHTNNGNALRDDGQTSNIALFNAESSVVYSSVSYSF